MTIHDTAAFHEVRRAEEGKGEVGQTCFLYVL